MNVETNKNTLPFHLKLDEELKRRQGENKRYSLRAFAKSLELDPSYLSKLMKAHRSVSPAIEGHCSEKLGWLRDDLPTKPLPRLRDSYVTLDVDSFRLISEWYHYAIFELIRIKGTQWNAESVAQSLNISPLQAQDGLGRLERLGLIRASKNTYVRSKRGITTTGNAYSIAAFRSLQKQVLAKAIDAMETIPMERRDQSSMTLAIPSSKIPKAKKMLAKFRRRFCREMQKEGDLDSVYQLGLSFYPITKSNLSNSTSGHKEN